MTPAEAHQKLISLCNARAFQEAAKLANVLTSHLPDEPVFWFLLGCIRFELGELALAEDAFRTASKLNPTDASTWYNLGKSLRAQDRPIDAITAYRQALQLDPNHTDTLTNLGAVLRHQGDLTDATKVLLHAYSINPRSVTVALNLADVQRENGQLEQAIQTLERLRKVHPDDQASLAMLLRLKGDACDFSLADAFSPVRETLGILGAGVSPFMLLHMEDHPERQLQRSAHWSRTQFPDLKPSPIPSRQQSKIRIGYFSACFHDHPWLYLASNMLSSHDKSRFEVFGYSLGSPRPSQARDKILPFLERFQQVDTLTDQQLAEMVKKDALDIAIDVDGHTRDARLGAFAHRLAPVQVSYLGYPGSIAAAFIDYIVADKIVVPDRMREHYSEKIAFMPKCYAPWGEQGKKPAETERRDHGLPDNAIVLCCFNNPIKIGSAEFDIWMRVLTDTEECVLWLSGANQLMKKNLSSAAKARGVSPDRLVFAPRVRHDAHLERYRHADLFVDTFNFNAHTTANDALICGVPLITKTGHQFAARVATSLLYAAGQPELTTETETEYETLLLELVRNPERLQDTKAKLARYNANAQLSDTRDYIRFFEAGLEEMHRRSAMGLPPTDIDLTNLSD